MKEIRHHKTIKNKRNLNSKWLLLQNDQNADTTLLHSHEYFVLLIGPDIFSVTTRIPTTDFNTASSP